MSRSILIAASIVILLSSLPVFGQLNRSAGVQKRGNQIQNVRFTGVEAVSDGNGALLRWSTGFERDNLGFTVFRASAKGWEKLGANIVPGSYFSIEPHETYGRDYRFFDPKGDFSSRYFVQASDLYGRSYDSAAVYPGYSSDFASIAGTDSKTMIEATLSANPITSKNETFAPKQIATGSGNLPPNQATQFWVAARPGVKLGVKSEGIYRVSRTELENAGFDVNTDPELWQLYLNGNEQSIIVDSNGDFIEFYGKGIDIPETDVNIYFLVVGDVAGARISNVTRTPAGSDPVASYDQQFYRRDRSLYASSVLNGPEENYFGTVVRSTPSTIQFAVDGIDFSVLKATVQIGLQGFTATPHKVRVKVNGVPFGSLTFYGGTYMVADVGIPTAILVNGINTIELAAISGGVDLSLVTSIRVRYNRNYLARSNGLDFAVPENKQAVLTGFTDPAIRVFDVSFPDSPALVDNIAIDPQANLGTEYQATIPANSAAMMFATADSAVKSVFSISANTPSTLSSVLNSGDMLIVSYKDWMTEAGDWATYRQNNGIDAVLVDVEDVYDEFGYGIRSSESVKEFIHYARLNWATGPGYVLLLGDASYDPRNYLGFGFFDFVPTELVDTAYEETGSDEALADYDEDGLSEISIGRAPVRSGTQATASLAKVMGFEQSVGTAAARGSLCVSDLFDLVDFEALCGRVQAELPGTIPAAAVNRGDVDAKATMLNEMNLGKYLVNYSGHGGSTFWAQSNFFSVGDVATLTNANDLTIFTMLTCLNGYFIEPDRDSLSERLFNKIGGASVAVWSSSGKTTPDVQEILARRFYSQLGNNPALDRIGDLVKDAKTAVVAGRDVRLSWTLLGDPAMKVK